MYGANLDLFHSHWNTKHLPNKFSVYTSANCQFKTEYRGILLSEIRRTTHLTDKLNLTNIQSPCSFVHFMLGVTIEGVCVRCLMDRQHNPFNVIHKIRWNLSTSFLYSSFKQVLVDLTHSGLMPITVFKGNIFLFSSGIWVSYFSMALCKFCYWCVLGSRGLTGDITVTFCLLILSSSTISLFKVSWNKFFIRKHL